MPLTMSTVRLLLTLFSLLCSVLSCPSGGDRVWVELGDSCYSVSQQAMDWGTAQEVREGEEVEVVNVFLVLVLLVPGRVPG